MPDPNDYDNKDDFMAVCIPQMIDEIKIKQLLLVQVSGKIGTLTKKMRMMI